MSIEEIRDGAGNVIGTIETDGAGRQTAKHADGSVRGYYDPDGDFTRDEHENIVAKGNRLRAMIC
jgi:hypothetical protein